MKVIGFSSGAVDKVGNVDRMVQAVLDATGWESKFVKLTDIGFSGCRGCVNLCSGPQVCKLDDGMEHHYQAVKDADAVVLGSPNYFGTVNTIMRSFTERFFGYRHVTNAIAGKPFVSVMSGFRPREHGEGSFIEHLHRNGIRPVATVYHVSESPPCLYCGRHHECRIGGLYGTYGEEALTMEVTPKRFKQWEDNPEAVAEVEKAAEELRLFEGG